MLALEDELVVDRHVRRFRRGEPIYFEGDSAETWFEVTEGVVRTCRFHADGHRQLTAFHYAGGTFGLEECSRLESAEAVTDVVCWYATKPIGVPATDAAVASLHDYEVALAKALHSASRSIFLFGRRTAPQRLAAFLLITAEQLRAQADLVLPMCRSDIADYLGLTIYTVSRTMTQFCEDHLISLQGLQHICILDRSGLSILAGERCCSATASDLSSTRSAGVGLVAPAMPQSRALSETALPSKNFNAASSIALSGQFAPSCHRGVE